eukprot:2474975-Rhodomonas_salina.1
MPQTHTETDRQTEWSGGCRVEGSVPAIVLAHSLPPPSLPLPPPPPLPPPLPPPPPPLRPCPLLLLLLVLVLLGEAQRGGR